MRVIISADASIDLVDIADFIAKDNLNAAFSFVQRLRNRCLQLGQFPNVGRMRDDIRPDLRSVAEGEYIILYRVTNDHVVILRIVHGKRDFSRLTFGE